MLASKITYVAVASNDPEATCSIYEKYFELPRTDFNTPEGKVSLFSIGQSALAVVPLGHSLIDGDVKPGVHHIAFGLQDPEAAVKNFAFTPTSAVGLDGRRSFAIEPAQTCGVRVRLTEPLALPTHMSGAIERIDHLGIASTDVAEDERVFANKLGFAVESRQTDMEVNISVESFTSDKYGVVYHTQPPKPVGGLRVTFITIGDLELEFLANFDPSQGAHIEHGQSGSTKQDQGAITRFVQSRGRGLHHIAIKASDINGTLQKMSKAGFQMIDQVGRPGSRRALIGFPHPKSTGGILMHLVQRDV